MESALDTVGGLRPAAAMPAASPAPDTHRARNDTKPVRPAREGAEFARSAC